MFSYPRLLVRGMKNKTLYELEEEILMEILGSVSTMAELDWVMTRLGLVVSASPAVCDD